MQITTTRFGALDIDSDELVHFPVGIPGFGDLRRAALLSADGNGTWFWLQDVDNPDLALLVVDPWDSYPDYDIDVDIDIDPNDVYVLAIVSARPDSASVNLRAPIVIDLASRVARQIIVDDLSIPLRAPIEVQ
jgi:flagellar assembly factor FliW